MTITVVGIGADGWQALPPASRAELETCDVLLGGPRQLDLVPDGPYEKRPWPSPLLPALDDVLAELAGRRVGVLASGDPLLSGIGGTLIRRLGADAVRIVPAVSSVTLARARLGWTAEETDVVSAVGRDARKVLRALAPGRRLLVLSSGADTPATLAALLADHGFGDSTLTVLENLGSAEERRLDGTARDWPHPPGAPLNVVAITCAGAAYSLLAGLPDEAFDHDGQLTKRDLRASALARLAPTPGELLWDVGAGAGSVAVEWCRAHPANRAVAVESRPERAERIARNAAGLGVPDIEVVTGSAPDALAGLDTPDAVFVGGGVAGVGVLTACWDALRSGGRLVAHGVTLEAEQALAARYADRGGELTRISVERAAPLGGLTGWSPARAVTQWSVRKP
ncbi:MULTISPECIES: precorrin-6y C5,15-methyltransferase (decarboxylating) subunit CbiE [Prauserella salsuginis group]|uniref:Precorrin-6Y C5,15-methyltransferase (Decarboxylating) n=2 Tax=Prauserella salsuginis group TaxID=2893672 RepID=A0A839XJ07_9PSEU|nr:MULTISPECIES: precorrin-6y C5,15-methyltransferase (decarboxylating) subunit CbiE [Prauserella salsuginis group]MBB3661544.1 precorrin-6Y C5,15-methyltransferase (decarboxylating) [Prauserella sediminis]MCR3719461.1 precorrin-6Y C5,15-methyltransferase (decarboxylating) [Prauserella flava]MCR3735525.1 precorrin-6Y C5,15-methyltransferase (decarboxylating) [Prauserella salsuginis]